MKQDKKIESPDNTEGHLRPRHNSCISPFIAASLCLGMVALVAARQPDLFRPPYDLPAFFLTVTAAIGLFALFAGFVSLCRWLRFRKTRFIMETVPGVIGGKLTGNVQLPGKLAGQVIRIRLVNEMRTIARRGQNAGGRNTVRLYDEFILIKAGREHLSNGNLRLPVQFTIPHDAKDAAENRKHKYGQLTHHWVLYVMAPVKGFNLDLHFDVPVCRTADSDPSIEAVPAPTREHWRRILELEPYRRIRTARHAGTTHYIVNRLAGLPQVWFLPLLSAAFIGIAILLTAEIWPFHSIEGATWFENLIADQLQSHFGRTAAILFLVGTALLVWTAGSFAYRETWVHASRLHCRHGLLRPRLLTIDCDRIEAIRVQSRPKRGWHGRCDVIAEYTADPPWWAFGDRFSHRKLLIAGDITSRIEADWRADELTSQVLSELAEPTRRA